MPDPKIQTLISEALAKLPKSPKNTAQSVLWQLYPYVRQVVEGDLPEQAAKPCWSVRCKVSYMTEQDGIWSDFYYELLPVKCWSLTQVYDSIAAFCEAEVDMLAPDLTEARCEAKKAGLSVSLSNGGGACVQQFLFTDAERMRKVNLRALVVRGDCSMDDNVAALLADGSKTFAHPENSPPKHKKFVRIKRKE